VQNIAGAVARRHAVQLEVHAGVPR
jgi:hypothetical protein